MAKKTQEEIDAAAEKKAKKLLPQVQKHTATVSYEWALNPMKLGLATKHVDETYSGLTGPERHDKIKERYLELKGRVPGEKRHKDGQHGTGKPGPVTSEQAIAYDNGEEGDKKNDDDNDDDDEEDVDELIEEQL